MLPLAPRHLLSAAVLAAATLAAPATPAIAGSDPGSHGCVSNAEYRKLANGQRLRYIRSVAGDDAQIGKRYWTRSGNRYQERRYKMCTPRSSAHDTLFTRFMVWQGSWRAYVVDTHIGPDPD